MLTKRNKIFILFAGIIIIAGFIYLLESSGIIILPFKKHVSLPVKVGIILPLDNPTLPQGDALKRAAELAVAEINQNGGAGGKKLKLIARNGSCDKNKATVSAEQLILKDKVKFILGGFCDNETLGIVSAANARGVIVMVPSYRSFKMPGSSDFTFRFAPADNLETFFAAKYARESLDGKKAVIISGNRSQNIALADAFAANFTKAGGEIVFKQNFHPRHPEFKKIVAELKNKDFDILYLMTEIPAIASQFVAELKSEGIEKNILMPAKSLSKLSLAEYPSLNGVTTLVPYFDKTNNLTQDFINAYQEKYGEPPAYLSDQAAVYSSIYLITEAVARYNLDILKVKNYFNKLKNKPSAFGRLTFDKNNNLLYSYQILKVEGGKLVSLKIINN